MTLDDFKNTLSDKQPPKFKSEILLVLWYDGKGDWNAAHEVAQSQEGVQVYDRLHAYLHRKEGDNWNANYWYRIAGETMPKTSLNDEWEMLVERFL